MAWEKTETKINLRDIFVPLAVVAMCVHQYPGNVDTYAVVEKAHDLADRLFDKEEEGKE